MSESGIEAIFEHKLPQLYEVLVQKERNGEIVLNKCCYPFLPYVGRNYFAAKKKILYVGKETNGWGYDAQGKISLFDAVQARTQAKALLGLVNKFMKENIEEYYGGLCISNIVGGDGCPTSFWKSIYELTISLHNNRQQLWKYREVGKDLKLSSECFSSIAWTELFKIGGVKEGDVTGRPDKTMCKFLINNFMTLQEEISYLKPDLILFMTGNEYERYLEQVYPDWKPSVVKGTCAKIEGVYDNAIVIRTRHFQGMTIDELSELYLFIRSFSPLDMGIPELVT